MPRYTHPVAACILSVCGAVGLAACAPMEEPASDEYDATLAELDTERACFFAREVNGFSHAPSSPGGDDRIWVSTGVSERWLLETRGTCPELDFSQQIALDVRGSGSVCTGQLEMLLVPNVMRGDFDRCPVRVLGRTRD
ncbi:DUF6491 family protein [Aurantiacibacter sp. MUD11]|uniref:DUF6491 family protein n=1 Tax=Aurantiacibacter sp. MUD11 TaxID=3003265 RepID=UPI0022AB32C6|nr:DUF6491 family protein [Aurantiacibacter sp. MUD11]WAT17658.1 DUF6491 family protein [Aurantiacibacter sp. MUD11]